MKKIKMAVCTILAASLLLATGCEADPNAGKTKIRFSTWDSADNLDEQQALVDRFNQSQEEIYVTLEAYGGEYDTKINASMGAGDAPDVMYMWNYPVYSGGLEPLDSYIEQEGAEYKDNFFEAVLEYNSFEGKTYGIPVGFSTHALYYNKAHFDAAGIDYPTDQWTWDDVKAAAKTITENVDGVTGYSYKMVPYIFDFEMFLWGNGTGYVDETGNLEGNLNSPEAIEVLSLFQQMTLDGHAIGTSGSGYTEFAAGSTAMYINASWALGSAIEAGIDYGLEKVPMFGSAPSASVVSTSGVAMSADSENKDAAWEFIKYWTSEELNVERLDYELPPLKSVAEEHGVLTDPAYEAFYQMLEQSSGYVPTSNIVPDDWSVINEELLYAFERIYNPSTLEDPTLVLNDAVEELK